MRQNLKIGAGVAGDEAVLAGIGSPRGHRHRHTIGAIVCLWPGHTAGLDISVGVCPPVDKRPPLNIDLRRLFRPNGWR